jgi:hypothetical protein
MAAERSAARFGIHGPATRSDRQRAAHLAGATTDVWQQRHRRRIMPAVPEIWDDDHRSYMISRPLPVLPTVSRALPCVQRPTDTTPTRRYPSESPPRNDAAPNVRR